MHKLRISLKMMLWYTLLTIILLAIFLPISYNLISNSMYDSEKARLRSAASQAILSCKFIDGSLDWSQAGSKFQKDVFIYVADNSGNVLYNNSDLDWISDKPYNTNTIWTKTQQDSSWMVYDKTVNFSDQLQVYIRVCDSLESTTTFLNNMKISMMIGAPVYLFIAVLGSWLIAKRALKPISKIADTAAEIEQGNLSRRIEGIQTKDEVGHLANIFNRMLEHLEESFRRERQFSSNASHELRTPVTIIMAYTEALLAKCKKNNENMNDDQLSSLELIHTECRKMDTVISQLLMLARGYEGKYAVEFESIDLNAIIVSVMEQFQDQANESAIRLISIQDEEITFTADQSLITQMLINLVGNGIKYGKSGGFVKVTAKKETGGVHITVEDNGIGIGEQDLPYIFERFYRVDKSRDRDGTGLGLSIVKWIVEVHHGTISVSSEINKGTVFSIII